MESSKFSCMTRAVTNRRPDGTRLPGFRWQAVLIVLPLVVLTLVGLLSLRQDRLLAREEARERAARLATDLAEQIRLSLVELLTQAPALDVDAPPLFRTDAEFRLIDPPAVEPVPTPEPLELSTLPEASRELWNKATQAEAAGEPARASFALRDFLEASPPEPFAAAALYRSALLGRRAGDNEAASAALKRLLTEHPRARGESGLPLAPLVEWQQTELAWARAKTHPERVALLTTACSNLVWHPTALSPFLLGKAAALLPEPAPMGNAQAWLKQMATAELRAPVEHWKRIWGRHEVARRLQAAVLAESGRHGAVGTTSGHAATRLAPLWTRTADHESPDEEWLVVRTPRTNLTFAGLSRERLLARWKDQTEEPISAPAYLSFTMVIGGRAITEPSPHPVLAEATARPSGSTPDPLPTITVRAHLSDPQALLARQRQRSWWFAGLVLTSSAAAGLGLRQAYRAFGRQLRLNELKSNFVSSVSHELRAPIASMRLLAENLEGDKVPGARQRDYFRMIVQECRRLSSLIENVLDFSRIDQGRKQYEFEPTDLSALVNQTVQLMEPYAAERQVRLECQVPEQCQWVADGRALQQALVNLLDNALKHSPAQSVITISLQSLPTGAVRLVVADHGPGIPAEEQERIFEPFYRRGSELRRETTGVGIGLTIVRHIVTAHHGRVWVESTPGEGSRFLIEVPVTAATPVST